MCTLSTTHGIRMFLYGVLELIKGGEQVPCKFIEDNLSTGIATVLRKKYPDNFSDGNPDNDCEIDEFYRKFIGCADGAEGKYYCDQPESDGLYLLITLALDELF